jgi:general secretion pathway protein B
MSYILEALKKAQAERQLGNAPTIHAPQTVQVEPARAPASRKPLLIGLAVGVLVAAVATTFVWRRQAPVQVAAVVAPAAGNAPAPAPASAAAVNPAPAVASPAAPVAQAVAPAPAVERVAPVPAPRAPVERRAAAGREPAAREPVGQEAGVAASAAGTLASSSREAAPVAAQVPSPPVEEYVRTLAELPDTIRREVPKVAFGGYMYSPNPADRLVLVDKTLRHEGEEVAPGLVLEKLLPKSAVLSYKGYRYRVGL